MAAFPLHSPGGNRQKHFQEDYTTPNRRLSCLTATLCVVGPLCSKLFTSSPIQSCDYSKRTSVPLQEQSAKWHLHENSPGSAPGTLSTLVATAFSKMRQNATQSRKFTAILVRPWQGNIRVSRQREMLLPRVMACLAQNVTESEPICDRAEISGTKASKTKFSEFRRLQHRCVTKAG